MSDIKAGDLVVVIKPSPCCGNTDALGSIFTVIGIGKTDAYCKRCGTVLTDEFVKVGYRQNVQMNRVKKINPSRDEDYIESTEDNHALA